MTLLTSLYAFQDNAFTGVKTGRLVISHAGAGKSVQFAIPAIWQSFQQDEFFALTEELIATYANALAVLPPLSTDDTVFNTMMASDNLATITSVYKDFTLLRWPTRTGATFINAAIPSPPSAQQVVEYNSNPNTEGVKPLNTAQPALAYKATGGGTIYTWVISLQAWL